MSQLDRFWAVIPAGGAGTRLWPLSRAASPKFLHDLTGSGRSLLQATVDRLEPLTADRILVVTGEVHRDAVLEQLPHLPAGRVLTEPSARDSMAAIGLAAATLERQDPDAVIGSFAADHVISGQDRFEECVRAAVAAAEQDLLVTIGIRPTHPSTGFGYIRVGDPVAGLDAVRSVEEFVEKPDLARAKSYLETGRYRWNAGMFVVRARVLLDLLAQWHPELARGLREIAADPATLTQRWADLEKIAIDHAVAEPAAAQGRVAVVPGDFGWDDVGDFASLSALLPSGDTPGVRVLGDEGLVRMTDSSGVVVTGGGRHIAVVGLSDVVVVDTGDALLVTTTEHAQEVKKVVEALREEGRIELT